MRNIHLFETTSAFTEEYNSNYNEPWLSYTLEDEEVNYNKDYTRVPFTIEILTDGTFNWGGGYDGETLSVSKNGGNWETVTFNEDVSVSAGDTLQYKGENTSLGYCTVYSTAEFNVKGNIMSLLYGDDFMDKHELTEGGEFTFLFNYCNTIISAKDLKIPVTVVADYSFGYDDYEGGGGMFNSCSNLVDAPELPATTIGYDGYAWMFKNCTSLLKAPELPATNLGTGCYASMFYGCTSLTKAPSILPAMTLPELCYYSMFGSCESLTTAPEIPATAYGGYSCYYMFSNCTSLLAAPSIHATIVGGNSCRSMFEGCTSMTSGPSILPAETAATHCYWEMFHGCSSLTTAPTICLTTLAESCCVGMFEGCSSLVNAQSALPATVLAQSCYSSMFKNCTNLTTAPELPATTLVSGCYEYMFYLCEKLDYIKAMFTTTPENVYTRDWVYGVAASGTFVKNSAAQWSVTGGNGVPNNWTVETASA